MQSNCIYIPACHYLSEVTGKDGMIYQIGRLAGCERCAVIGWNREVEGRVNVLRIENQTK